MEHTEKTEGKKEAEHIQEAQEKYERITDTGGSIQESDAYEDKIVDKESKRTISTRLIALFVIGVLIGITLKTHAVQKVTMGFDDYRIHNLKSDFDLLNFDERSDEQQDAVDETSD
ncbi:MAG: hypothetical protein U9M90_00450 [Patescibacteria group bacterium]|nr:hypothetical protein [Patescibacteria group bacterium]